MARITVTHLGGDAFDVHTRGHTFCTDQPSPGRVEIGPTPTEVFVAGLAACAGYYAEHFLRRHNLPHQGLRVECDWALRAAAPSRITRVRMRVVPPEPLPQPWRDGLIAAVRECTVHNSLRQPPDIAVEVSDQPLQLATSADRGIVAATDPGKE